MLLGVSPSFLLMHSILLTILFVFQILIVLLLANVAVAVVNTATATTVIASGDDVVDGDSAISDNDDNRNIKQNATTAPINTNPSNKNIVAAIANTEQQNNINKFVVHSNGSNNRADDADADIDNSASAIVGDSEKNVDDKLNEGASVAGSDGAAILPHAADSIAAHSDDTYEMDRQHAMIAKSSNPIDEEQMHSADDKDDDGQGDGVIKDETDDDQDSDRFNLKRNNGSVDSDNAIKNIDSRTNSADADAKPATATTTSTTLADAAVTVAANHKDDNANSILFNYKIRDEKANADSTLYAAMVNLYRSEIDTDNANILSKLDGQRISIMKVIANLSISISRTIWDLQDNEQLTALLSLIDKPQDKFKQAVNGALQRLLAETEQLANNVTDIVRHSGYSDMETIRARVRTQEDEINSNGVRRNGNDHSGNVDDANNNTSENNTAAHNNNAQTVCDVANVLPQQQQQRIVTMPKAFVDSYRDVCISAFQNYTAKSLDEATTAFTGVYSTVEILVGVLFTRQLPQPEVVKQNELTQVK